MKRAILCPKSIEYRDRVLVMALAIIFFLIFGFVEIASGLVAAQSQPTLKITDRKGAIVEVTKVKIDYTQYSISYTSDIEQQGIRVKQGAGKTTVAWNRIKELRFGDLPSGMRYDLPAEIDLVSGSPIKVDVVNPSPGGGIISHGRLQGTSALGDYSIDLDDIKTITVLPENRSK